jgi:hypothetical protein
MEYLREHIARNLKKIGLLVTGLLILAATGSCSSQKGEGFSIYLLARDIPVSQMPVVSHLEIAARPLISTRDIISYAKETHEIKLTDKVL